MIKVGDGYSCIGKGGLYVVISLPKPAGASKVFEDIVEYMDCRTGQEYWRFVSDFEDRMEKLDEENTEEAIRNKERI